MNLLSTPSSQIEGYNIGNKLAPILKKSELLPI